MRPPAPSDPLPARIRRYFEQAPAAGAPAAGEAGWGRGAAGSDAAEARVVAYLRLAPDGRVAALRYQAWGCPHVLATLAWLAEAWPGRPPDELPAAGPEGWARELCVPIEKLGRLLVIEDALRAARADAPKP